MANMRVVYDNAIDRATLSSSGDASTSMGCNNLKTDLKSSVWRGTAKSGWLSAVWSSLESIGCVAMPFCNLSPTATVRVRVTSEAQMTNLAAGSESLSSAAGWAGCTLGTSSATYANSGIQYVTIAKATTSTSESRSLNLGGVTANSTYTLTVALRAGTSSQISVGLYDSSGGTNWGTSSTSKIVSGPGSIVSTPSNGLVQVSGLSASQDTLVQLTRTYTVAGQMVLYVYPDTQSSTTVGLTNLITRLQVEQGAAATSYYPALTASATRPLGYIDSWQSYTYDSGNVSCCPEASISLRGWTAAQSASAYAYGGSAFARVWLSSNINAYGLRVDVTDNNNLQGYVEAARLVAGPYWSTSYNPSSVTATWADTTVLTRLDSGDQWSDQGKVYQKMNIALSMMPAADRGQFVNLVRSSKAYPILVAVFPQAADTNVDRDNMIYGRRSADSDMAIQAAMAYSSNLQLESV